MAFNYSFRVAVSLAVALLAGVMWTVDVFWGALCTCLLYTSHHLSSVLGVQVTGRLIGEYQLGIGYDRTGYRHTLLLTAGKLLREVFADYCVVYYNTYCKHKGE